MNKLTSDNNKNGRKNDANKKMNNEHTATISFLKQKLPTLKSMYDHLENKGWFLPPYQIRGKKSKVWSQKYLLRLLEGTAYRIHRD